MFVAGYIAEGQEVTFDIEVVALGAKLRTVSPICLPPMYATIDCISTALEAQIPQNWRSVDGIRLRRGHNKLLRTTRCCCLAPVLGVLAPA